MLAQPIDIQGHRGCRGLKPENTIEAFTHALYSGVSTIELDVCISKDKKVVVSHEPYMNALFCIWPNGKKVSKTDEKSLNLYKMSYVEIKKFDTGSNGNPLFVEQEKIKTYKPLLSKVFETIEKTIKNENLNPVNYNIEIKSEELEYNVSQPEVAEFAELLKKIIAKKVDAKRITIQSFDFNVLKYIHKLILVGKYPKVSLAALVENEDIEQSFDKLGFLPDIFSPFYKQLTAEKVDFCHKKNVKVIPWTINIQADMATTIAMGVDGIITDYPNRAIKFKQ